MSGASFVELWPTGVVAYRLGGGTTLREVLQAISLHPDSPWASIAFVLAMLMLLMHLRTASPHTDDTEYAVIFTGIAIVAGAIVAGVAQAIAGGTHRWWISVVYVLATVPALWFTGNGVKHAVLIPFVSGVIAYAVFLCMEYALALMGSI